MRMLIFCVFVLKIFFKERICSTNNYYHCSLYHQDVINTFQLFHKTMFQSEINCTIRFLTHNRAKSRLSLDLSSAASLVLKETTIEKIYVPAILQTSVQHLLVLS